MNTIPIPKIPNELIIINVENSLWYDGFIFLSSVFLEKTRYITIIAIKIADMIAAIVKILATEMTVCKSNIYAITIKIGTLNIAAFTEMIKLI